MSTLNFINSSALRGDASLISNSKLLLQSSGNTTATQSFIFNDGAASKLALGIGDPATSSNTKFFIDSAGDINISSNVGIGTAPQTNDDLAVKGNVHVISGLRDGSSSLGSNNYVLTSTGSAIAWADASSSSIIGGPYLPLTAGSSKPLSGDLYLTLSATDQRALSSTGTDSIQIGDAGVNELKFKNTFGTVVVMNASGRVGIGTTSPSTQVDIQSSVANSLRVKSDDSASIIIDSDGDNSGTAGSYLHYRDTGGTKWTLYKETNNDFYLFNAAASTYPIHAKAGGAIVLMEDGNNLGVGMSPTDKLEVAGNIRANVSNAGGFMLTGASASGLVRNNATGVALRTNTTDRLILDNSGNINFSIYGSGSVTGTVANLLAVDSSGNVIETSTSGEISVEPRATNGIVPIG